LDDERYNRRKHTQDEEEKEDLVLAIGKVNHGNVGEFVTLLKSVIRKQVPALRSVAD
jgi:hypothetical protein